MPLVGTVKALRNQIKSALARSHQGTKARSGGAAPPRPSDAVPARGGCTRAHASACTRAHACRAPATARGLKLGRMLGMQLSMGANPGAVHRPHGPAAKASQHMAQHGRQSAAITVEQRWRPWLPHASPRRPCKTRKRQREANTEGAKPAIARAQSMVRSIAWVLGISACTSAIGEATARVRTS